MDLLGVRTEFVKRSGRYDLVVSTSDFSDQGADFFIKKGIRFLDNLYETQDSVATQEITVKGGQPITEVPDLRAPHRVYYQGTDGEVELVHQTLAEIQARYGYATSFADIDPGEPVHYAVAVRRKVGVADTEDDQNVRIVTLPNEATDRKLTVEGLFYSTALAIDADVNWWTIAHPDLVVEAALLALEKFYKNWTGVRDHRLAIEEELSKLDQNVAETASANADVIRDSW